MSAPSFTAEVSLFRTSSNYYGRAGNRNSIKQFTQQGNIEPQWLWKIPAVAWFAKKAFYAGCYYACVADTGDWEECGNRCPGGGL